MTAEDCLKRFLHAVREARYDNFAPGRALIRSVRQRFGDATANRQRSELEKYVSSKESA